MPAMGNRTTELAFYDKAFIDVRVTGVSRVNRHALHGPWHPRCYADQAAPDPVWRRRRSDQRVQRRTYARG
eukprot:6478512-Lingulodinium_polyedra.AAC.1